MLNEKATMKAVAVDPGTPDSVHLVEMEKPSVDQIPDGQGVLVKVLRVGVDGTDREINEGKYGVPPEGCDFLVIGHENSGRVETVGPNIRHVQPGDYVVATVRRPGKSLHDRIGAYDFSSDETYFERGISRFHGYLCEYYVDHADHIVRVPAGLKQIGVLLEPASIVEKGIHQAYEIQRRLRVWHPRRAAVMGVGTIGLLATLALKLRGLEVTAFGLDRKPYLNSNLVESLGCRYESTRDTPILKYIKEHGPFDLIFEATGFSPIVFESMQGMARNGVLILTSVTGGDRRLEIPADRINLEFVLGNKVMVGTVSASRADFEMAIKDLAQAEASHPGWLLRLLTHPVRGLENYRELFDKLATSKGAIKVYCEAADF